MKRSQDLDQPAHAIRTAAQNIESWLNDLEVRGRRRSGVCAGGRVGTPELEADAPLERSEEEDGDVTEVEAVDGEEDEG